MLHKKIRLNISGEKIIVSISGEAAKNALGELYDKLIKTDKSHDAGLAAIEMFLQLFGEEIAEKLLRFCERNPGRAMRICGRLIRKKIYPLAVKQRKYEDRQGVKKYL
jgi:hypothetical protein